MPSPVIIQGCKLIGSALNGETYAVSGGAAVVLLGSSGDTGDIDIAIPRGATTSIKNKIAAIPGFSLIQPERHIFYTHGKTEVAVEAVPPSLTDFKLDHTTPTVMVHGVKVLHPTVILESKCKLRRGKRDDQDIVFLVKWPTHHKEKVTAAEIPHCRTVPAAAPLFKHV